MKKYFINYTLPFDADGRLGYSLGHSCGALSEGLRFPACTRSVDDNTLFSVASFHQLEADGTLFTNTPNGELSERSGECPCGAQLVRAQSLHFESKDQARA